MAVADYPLSVEDAAEYLDVHPETVKRWIRGRKVAALKTPGGSYRLRVADLEAAFTAVQPDGDAA